ncbi:MAG: amidohydrolase family protein [Actinomycetota bacterium]|nr:amidohydrolase family protein [Actinomycetota bacterium]
MRDLGGNWDAAISVARAVDRSVIEGPTILASGRTVIMTGGHDPFWGVPCDGPDAVVRGVRTQVAAGAHVIKTAATGGVYGQVEGEEAGASELTYEELAALAGEAHRRGRRVAVHALGTEGIRNAVRAGVDTVEHGVFLTEDIVAAMAERGTVLCPTVAVYRRMAQGSAPGYAVRKAAEVVTAHRESIAMARNAGLSIIAGTDAGAPRYAAPQPGRGDRVPRLLRAAPVAAALGLERGPRPAGCPRRPPVLPFVVPSRSEGSVIGASRRPRHLSQQAAAPRSGLAPVAAGRPWRSR